MKHISTWRLAIITLFALFAWHSKTAHACEIDEYTTGIGNTPAEYMELAENFCVKGQQVMLNRLRGWMVRFVVHGVCDLRYNVFVDRTEYDFEGKYNKPEEWLGRDNAIVCIYRGPNN